MEIGNIRNACSESLIVSLLRHGPRHGYEMGKEIESRSAGYFSFKHSTLYPVLHRLEKRGLIAGSWCQEGNDRPRKYYSLTAAGEAYGEEDTSQWRDFFLAMRKLMPQLLLEEGR